MRVRGIAIVLVALVVALMMTMTCLAGELTGSQNYSARMDAGELVVSSGTTLDYELVKDLFITFDIRSDYQWRSKPTNRYELSINYYPSWWLLEGWCVSAGVAARTRERPLYFVEVSKPIEWPPAWVRTILSRFRRE